MNNPKIDRILQGMLRFTENISDLHFYVGRPPQVEVSGLLVSVPINGLEKLSPFQLDVIGLSILGDNREAVKRFITSGAADLSYSIPGVTRFRVNVYRQRGSLSVVMRVIPYGVPHISQLGLPDTLYQVAEETTGIVLVTGPTGCGKSTTIAAIIDEINRKHAYHIVTVEDPIEYLYRHHASSICQRELGTDTTSFASALRDALRQSPKVIVVGEMRDMETAEIAMEAAETGHLVFSTLHTIDASKAIDRIIGMFPQTEEHQIRMRFAHAFRYVIAQRLIPRKDGVRVPVVEILKSTLRTRDYIIKGEAENRSLLDAMNDGFLEGMQSFDRELEKMVRSGVIEKDTAFRYATNAGNLTLTLQSSPEEENFSAVWEEIIQKEELNAMDLARIPDVIEHLKGEIQPDDVVQVAEKVLSCLNMGDSREKTSAIHTLKRVSPLLQRIGKADFQDTLSSTVEMCFQNEADEEALYAYIGYFHSEWLAAINQKNYGLCSSILQTISVQTSENDSLRRHLSLNIENLNDFLMQQIRAGGEAANSATEYLRVCGDKGAEFLFNWLAEEQERFLRVQLLNYIERLDNRFLAPQIEKRLHDYRWYVVRNMVTILCRIDLPETLSLLQVTLNHEEPRVAREVVKKLYQDPDLLDPAVVMHYMNHEDKMVQSQAVNLAGMGDIRNAVPAILRFLTSTSPADTELRAACLQASLKMKVREAIPLAQKILERKASSRAELAERNAAVKLLGELAANAFQDLLRKVAHGDANKETREIANSYL